MSEIRLAFIGFGEAARAFTTSLAAVAPIRVSAYDILFHAPPGDSRKRALEEAATRLGVTLTGSAAEAVAGADLVFSAVTAANAAAALAPVYDAPVHPHTLIDINSVTAGVKAANAARVRAAGARYLDMAVMAPVHPAGHRTPVLLAGDLEPALGMLQRLEFRLEVAGAAVGDAASVKMMRSLFVKGLEALTVQTLSAAQAAGCGEQVLASLSGSYPGLDLPRFAPYQFERVATHGIRRAEEMREVAAAMRELGFPEGTALAAAVAELQAAVAATGPATGAEALDCARATSDALRGR